MFRTGTLVLVDFGRTSRDSIAIVVDPVTGGRWARRDPLILEPENHPQGLANCLVRVLGIRVLNAVQPEETGLPNEEPNRHEVIRWAWVPEFKVQRIAGPDVSSIQSFLHAAQLCAKTGAELDFLEDLEYLVRFLLGETSKNHDFHRMLAEVLPS